MSRGLGSQAGEDGVVFSAKEEGGTPDAEAGGGTEGLDEVLFAGHGVAGAGHHGGGYLAEAERGAVELVGAHEAIAAAGAGETFGVGVEFEEGFAVAGLRLDGFTVQLGEGPMGAGERGGGFAARGLRRGLREGEGSGKEEASGNVQESSDHG